MWNDPRKWSRRAMLAQSGAGFGLLALADLLARKGRGDGAIAKATHGPHHPPRAKRIIFLYMPGGPSHVDLFDPKPELTRRHGEPLPFAKPKLERTKTGNLLKSPWKFARYGRSGIEVSELLPHTAKCVDDLCVIRSLKADNINHSGAAAQICTGEQAFSRPSMGSWLLYGLGTENENLPGFVVISPSDVFQGAQLWASSFLPGRFQGTRVRDLKQPIADLAGADGDDARRQFTKLDALREMNAAQQRNRIQPGRQAIDDALEARIASFELAFQMQRAAPEAFDIERESAATHRLYGIDDKQTELFGRQCLMARRLVERGVRFVHLFDAPFNNAWDHHGKLFEDLPKRCRAVDRPIAGLLNDLKARGLLDDTLVLWGGEFGRTPTAQGDNGREHNPFGFTMWLAGGGIRGGQVYGATDDFGWHAVENVVHVHDLHATILHLLGLDHERLTYFYGGRDYRLTDVSGRVVNEIFA